jgi:hypothetical protein
MQGTLCASFYPQAIVKAQIFLGFYTIVPAPSMAQENTLKNLKTVPKNNRIFIIARRQYCEILNALLVDIIDSTEWLFDFRFL